MSEPARSGRFWIGRVRALSDRGTREHEGVCFVEGIRQVLSAHECGWQFEAVLVNPDKLRSEVALTAVANMQREGVQVAELSTRDFERISTRDNPAGIAAIVRWSPLSLEDVGVDANGLYALTDQISDAGNLGTLMRTADSLGVSAVITHAGVDPAHPAALRASLGSAFQIPVATSSTLDDALDWCATNAIRTVATSAKADRNVWDVDLTGPVAIVLGNEGRGLTQEAIMRCDASVLIPMSGSATSLNVGVAAGIILYESLRQRSSR
jgi:RNA methyltransferase, TrmH family